MPGKNPCLKINLTIKQERRAFHIIFAFLFVTKLYCRPNFLLRKKEFSKLFLILKHIKKCIT